MNPNILHQIQELANSGEQEILMREAEYRHDINEFINVEDKQSFEFKTTNSCESPYRYIFKRKLYSSNHEPTILISADFLEKELKEYEKRKRGLHHYLVFMYDNCMIKYNMKDIQKWFIEESPDLKCAQIRNKKCQDGSFTPSAEYVYYIPTSSVPCCLMDYMSNEILRNDIYGKWLNPSDSPDAEPTKAPALQATFISPYF